MSLFFLENGVMSWAETWQLFKASGKVTFWLLKLSIEPFYPEKSGVTGAGCN